MAARAYQKRQNQLLRQLLGMKIDQKFIERIGWAASIIAILMWFSFIDQIRLNLAGHKGSLLIPIVVTINCVLWTLFGLGKKNWQIVTANVPGIFTGAITVLTAL
ncbi:MAG: MtN3/saliva family [Candidatus Levybacteria bacterium GW2011_GWA2_37_36]|nr:MAG: MtN3/saliva family [Candidatus Levybacteria bacterium GW2011_GWA1_37_16]KKQ32013.1 MAG: MtN3/saliva family [Candidatus Levybacteria bacterium GW2011_GWA2_37_36]